MGLFNILAAKWLAYFEGTFAVLHLLAFIPFIVVLWVMTPTKQPASDFYLNFADHGAKKWATQASPCSSVKSPPCTQSSAPTPPCTWPKRSAAPASSSCAQCGGPSSPICRSRSRCSSATSSTSAPWTPVLAAFYGFPSSIHQRLRRHRGLRRHTPTTSPVGTTGLTFALFFFLLPPIISTSCMASHVPANIWFRAG